MNGQRRPVIEVGEQRQNVNVFLMICVFSSSVASSKTERNSSSISAFINDPSLKLFQLRLELNASLTMMTTSKPDN